MLAHLIAFSHSDFRFFFIIFRQLDEIHASVSIMTRNCMRRNRLSVVSAADASADDVFAVVVVVNVFARCFSLQRAASLSFSLPPWN